MQLLRSYQGFPGDASGTDLPPNAGDMRDVGLTPGSGRSPGGGNSNPFKYSCLENPRDRDPWRAIVRPLEGYSP